MQAPVTQDTSGECAAAFADLLGEHDRDLWRTGMPEELILARLAAGPVPPALVVRLAARAQFPGLALIERAAAEAGGGGLFAAPEGDDPGAGMCAPEPAGSRSGTDGTIEAAAEDGAPGPSGACDAAELAAGVEAAFERIHERLGERREGQLAVARMAATALAGDEIALIEAGTGTGKSLAYLVPALLFAAATGERVVVSTHTIHLQDQLWQRDYPLARWAVGLDARAERLTGRENYLCARRIVAAVMSRAEDDPRRALSLALAAALCASGSAAALPAHCRPPALRSITAPPRCLMNGCAHAAACPLLAARRRAAEAAVVFVNHALLLTDHRQGGGVIGPYRRVIIDEAHHLERSIMENLSVRVARNSLERLFEQVGPVSEQAPKWRQFAAQIEAFDQSSAGPRLVASLAEAVLELEAAHAALFATLSAGWSSAERVAGSRTRYRDGSAIAQAALVFHAFYRAVSTARGELRPLIEARAGSAFQPLQAELSYIEEELAGLAESTRYLEGAEDPEGVFWIEWGRDGSAAALCGSPLDVDRRFADYLEERVASAVLTSATLARSGSFEHIAERLGIALAGREALCLLEPSPFDYKRSLLILRQPGPGDPNDGAFAGAVADTVERLARTAERSSMVLFTSYRMCRATAAALAGRKLPGPVFIQEEGESRDAIAARFRRSQCAILLGVASFWEGVDFPGEQLEVLVIPKIPFPVPTEPVIEARSERLARDGQNPFERLSLPEAELRLRQGVGRLIRRRGDRGVVVLMDPRLGVMRYAASLLAAMPVASRVVASAQEAALAARDWLDA